MTGDVIYPYLLHESAVDFEFYIFFFILIFFFFLHNYGGTKRHFSLFRWNMFKMQRTARVLHDSIVDYLHFLLILPNKERQLGNTNNIKVA